MTSLTEPHDLHRHADMVFLVHAPRCFASADTVSACALARGVNGFLLMP